MRFWSVHNAKQCNWFSIQSLSDRMQQCISSAASHNGWPCGIVSCNLKMIKRLNSGVHVVTINRPAENIKQRLEQPKQLVGNKIAKK